MVSHDESNAAGSEWLATFSMRIGSGFLTPNPWQKGASLAPKTAPSAGDPSGAKGCGKETPVRPISNSCAGKSPGQGQQPSKTGGTPLRDFPENLRAGGHIWPLLTQEPSLMTNA